MKDSDTMIVSLNRINIILFCEEAEILALVIRSWSILFINGVEYI